MHPVSLSGQLLLAVKKQQKTTELKGSLAELTLKDIATSLVSDDAKKTFWINLYNAFYQILRLEDGLKPPDIYRQPAIRIAGKTFSLDDIEHGILRKYRYKRAPEQFSEMFDPALIRSLAVEQLDYRIHFALNCGAESCPPIAFYREDQLESQLNLATQSFLEGESTYDEEQKTLHTTALFEWFADDFGGEAGIKTIYQNQLGLELKDYDIKYKDYSWDEALGNFAEE